MSSNDSQVPEESSGLRVPLWLRIQCAVICGPIGALAGIIASCFIPPDLVMILDDAYEIPLTCICLGLIAGSAFGYTITAWILVRMWEDAKRRESIVLSKAPPEPALSQANQFVLAFILALIAICVALSMIISR